MKTTTPGTLGLTLAAAVSSFLAVSAWAEIVTDHDRFQLWNGCKPIDLLVEGLSADAADIGLTEEAIETAVRSRLRAARLYDTGSRPYLYVNVNIVRPAFNIRLSFKKYLYDVVSKEAGFGATWWTGGTGTHGGDSNYIVSSVSRRMDGFIDEYLRVNADACASR